MRKLFGTLATAALICGLSGCGSEPDAPVEVSPEAPEGISVAGGRMNLPAASGNPAALYFTITNDGSADQMMRSVNVPGAESTQFHETVQWPNEISMQELLQVNVAAGESVTFEPGAKHVMVFGLPEGLNAGEELEVTVSFVRGDKVSFPARLLAPGDDGSSMEMSE